MRSLSKWMAGAAALILSTTAFAQPSGVQHTPAAQAYGQATGVTQRNPAVPRESDTVTLYFQVCCQFTYDHVAVYYTTDGSVPAGAFGTPAGTTQAATNTSGGVTFLLNQTSGGSTYDWWSFTLPSSAMTYGATINYTISAWKAFAGAEVFANGGAPYSYANKLAWPGAGAGQATPATGYPPVSFWKEEAVFGNTFTAGMIDQNGTVYDMHFPTPGGVYGVGTHNEGYVDGPDTFPPLLPAGWRGQMNLDQAMAGIRVDGLTHWLSNPNSVSFSGVQQSYTSNSNSISTSQSLTYGGNNIAVQQYDFAPMGVAFPSNLTGGPERHIYLKRMILTNNGPAPKTVDVYWYMAPQLNGGNTYQAMFWDSTRGAMTVYDKTTRTVTGTGVGFTPPNEYNPTTNAGYVKNIALYLSACMKTPGNVVATDNWRDTSADNGNGWLGEQITLQPGVAQEVDFMMAGSYFRPANPLTDPMPVNDGVYNNNLQPVLDWFRTSDISALHAQTDAYWNNWLASGTTASTPDAGYNRLLARGLLATALHVDGVNGGVIAGFHNGAYPYVWPRDAVYAAITLARTGHLPEAAGVYSWMQNTCYRDTESWGRKGFWKQKYSTDGYVIWGAPQIDETAVFPWGVYYQYKMTNDIGVLNTYIEPVRDAVLSCTSDSSDSRLYFVDPPGDPCSNDSPNLMHSNNVWEDSYATFIYSNANIVRGLQDAASIFGAIGSSAEQANATSLGATIKSGLDARLSCLAENTDISQLGAVYPFNVYSPTDPLVTAALNRMSSGSTSLLNTSGQHAGTVNRYIGDSYWNGGPWFLSTAWYGLFYKDRADYTSGNADIDTHKSAIDTLIARLGPAGLGAEQIAYDNSLMYPGQEDFVLQTAWPNAWESMSTLVDSVMAFLDYDPSAPTNTMSISPKLPTAWSTMTFHNVTLVNTPAGQTHKVDVSITEAANGNQTLTFTNNSGFAVNMSVALKLPPGRSACSVKVNSAPTPYAPSLSGHTQINTFALATGAGAVTTLVVHTVGGSSPDFNSSGAVTVQDIFDFLSAWFARSPRADFNGSGTVTVQDIFDFLAAWFAGCP